MMTFISGRGDVTSREVAAAFPEQWRVRRTQPVVYPDGRESASLIGRGPIDVYRLRIHLGTDRMQPMRLWYEFAYEERRY